jgi:hypothetical protein
MTFYKALTREMTSGIWSPVSTPELFEMVEACRGKDEDEEDPDGGIEGYD